MVRTEADLKKKEISEQSPFDNQKGRLRKAELS